MIYLILGLAFVAFVLFVLAIACYVLIAAIFYGVRKFMDNDGDDDDGF